MSLLIRYTYLIILEIRQITLFSILYNIFLSKFALIINLFRDFCLKLILFLIRNTNAFYFITSWELIIMERAIMLYSYLLLVKKPAFLRKSRKYGSNLSFMTIQGQQFQLETLLPDQRYLLLNQLLKRRRKRLKLERIIL